MRADFWAGRRVLLTGHTGFKGGWLALWLERLGAEVTGFGAPPPTVPSLFELARVGEAVDDVRGDVRDAGAVEDAVRRSAPEVVLHLAAQPLVRRAWREPAEAFAVNALGTVHVLDAVRRHAPGAAVVVVTTDKVYADPDSGRRFTEDDPLGGKDPYSASKAAAELVAASYRDAHGLRVATARAGNVIGGGDWAEDRLIPDAVRAAAAGRPLEVRDPEAIRPWQHVLNPARRLPRAGRAAPRLGRGRHRVQLRPAARRPPAPRRPGSSSASPPPGATGGSPRCPAPPPDGPAEAARLGLDPTRAADRLGWTERWPLEHGLAATAEWYRRVLGGEDARAVTLAQISAFEGAGVAAGSGTAAG